MNNYIVSVCVFVGRSTLLLDTFNSTQRYNAVYIYTYTPDHERCGGGREKQVWDPPGAVWGKI